MSYKVLTDQTMEIYPLRNSRDIMVASECGFTPQYEGLEKLYEKYKDDGFMVLGFPCNQFREQEPKSNKEIKFFCQGTYHVSFDMFDLSTLYRTYFNFLSYHFIS